MRKFKNTKRSKKYLINTRKTLKKYKTNKILKKRGGSLTQQIDLRQILITKPMIDAIKEYNPDIDLKNYKLSKGEQGFRLNRMEQMFESNFDELLEKEPVELKVAKNSDGKVVGIRIDGIMKKMYEIINGRHRISRAIIEENKTINAKII